MFSGVTKCETKNGEVVGFWAHKKPFDHEYLENGKLLR